MTIRRDILQTSTGQRLNLDRFERKVINIRDIAHGLSQVCRFSGQTLKFVSVAGHSLTVAGIVRHLGGSVEAQLQALLHDASEAYMADLPSPIKARCPEYRAIESRLQKAIYRKFGLPTTMLPIVKEADDLALQIEREVAFDKEWIKRFADDSLLGTRCDFMNRFNHLYEQHYFSNLTQPAVIQTSNPKFLKETL